MKKSIWMVFLMAIILTLLVPLSVYVYQSELAFTSDNLIFMHSPANGQ